MKPQKTLVPIRDSDILAKLSEGNSKQRMAFPIAPDPRLQENEALFRVQDPFGLRRSITPVFIAHDADGRLAGCGTSFFITPFGKQLSAMHVITDFLNANRIAVPPDDKTEFAYTDSRIQVLFDPGLVFGTCPAGTMIIASAFVMFPVDQMQHPLAITRSLEELSEVEPALDLVSWDFANFADRRAEFLPVRLGRGPFVNIGDRVMAVGFPKNGGERQNGRIFTTFVEEMFASVGTVIEVDSEFDITRKRWPRIVVDTYWPPGMSGGPVFNETGEVIGIVSRGGENWSQALWLQKLPYSAEVYGPIDPDNPGWTRAWCVCNAHSVLKIFRSEHEALAWAAHTGSGLNVRFCSTPMGSQMKQIS